MSLPSMYQELVLCVMYLYCTKHTNTLTCASLSLSLFLSLTHTHTHARADGRTDGRTDGRNTHTRARARAHAYYYVHCTRKIFRFSRDYMPTLSLSRLMNYLPVSRMTVLQLSCVTW